MKKKNYQKKYISLSDMSSKIKNLVISIIKTNKSISSIEDIISEIKKSPEFSRQKDESLRPIIKTLIKEIKNRKSENSIKDEKKENNNFSQKKRSREIFPETQSFNIEKYLYIPKINLSNLGGMEEIIKELQDIISLPLNNYNLYKKLNILPIKGILLCGPPGCGKTTLAYAIGGQFKIPFYKITGPDIISSLSGESEQIIRNLFNNVIQNAPSILFIDEIETILGKREQANKEMERRIVAQIMTCIDDINDKFLSELNNPVFIIGATSKPEFIDMSMRRSGRFDKEIHIGFPSLEMREKMIRKITEKNLINDNVNYYNLAKLTPGYLAADLQSLVRTAGHHAIKRCVENNININLVNLDNCDFEYAIKMIQPTSKREGFSTIPNVSWDNIGGLKDLRNELYYDIVMPILEPKKLKLIGINKAIGVLLYGPPGCGKTLLAKAVANEAKANFISIKGPELLNKYVGESERAIRLLFIRAKNSSPCIIFFDELDALVPKRSNENNNSSERVVNQLLTEMDGLEDRKQIFIIAATNRPDIIDPAMLRPGRLDKLLYVPLPEKNDRISILETLIRNLPIEKDLNLIEVFDNEKLNGFSGADLAALVREAQLNALKRLSGNSLKFNNLELEDCTILKEDFYNAMNNVLPSVSVGDKKKYESLKRKIQETRSHIS
jgi:ribosome biogenesis ATPase